MAQLLSVVVPCFNEENVIRLTHDRIVGDLGSIPGMRLGIVYVNDGSRDATESILEGLAVWDNRVHFMQFRPSGRGNRRNRFRNGDAVAIIDADLQGCSA